MELIGLDMVGVEIRRSVIGIRPCELLQFGFRKVGGEGGPYVFEFKDGIVWPRRRCGLFRFKVVCVNRAIDIDFKASDIAAMSEILGIVMDALCAVRHEFVPEGQVIYRYP